MNSTTPSTNTAQREKTQSQLARLEKLAWLLDSSIRILGTKRTIGLDGIIGLVSGIGDASHAKMPTR